MPAVDKCEESIIKALAKEGWKVAHRPYTLKLGKQSLFADLRLKHENGDEIVIAEVKCFPPKQSKFDELYRAIGQYLVYRSIMKTNGIIAPLFLVIPQKIYKQLFQITSVQETLIDAKIKLIVVDLEREEVVLWQT